jgi:hypothetical protein
MKTLRAILITPFAATSLFAAAPTMEKLATNFGQDVAFLKEHTDVMVLRSGNAAIALTPAYQGRVMTSTATGEGGNSYGWMNYELIRQGVLLGDAAAGKLESKIHVFGGEERFWIGPEGGKLGIFFAPGAKFDFDHWKTPAAIDTEPFDVVSSDDNRAVLARSFSVSNQ